MPHFLLHAAPLAAAALALPGPGGSRQLPEQDTSMSAQAHPHTNRLIDETSPYLLQHAHNPVDWYPWGPEAIEEARREQKPDLPLHRLLGLPLVPRHGARESFENEGDRAIMNEHFVAIKVDREERPDLDEIYMRRRPSHDRFSRRLADERYS